MYSTVIKSLEAPAVIVRLASTGTEKRLEYEVRSNEYLCQRNNIPSTVVRMMVTVFLEHVYRFCKAS